MKRIGVATILALTAVAGGVTTATADTVVDSPVTSNEAIVDDGLIEKADKFVRLEKGEFRIDDSAHGSLTENEYRGVKSSVDHANAEIASIEANGTEGVYYDAGSKTVEQVTTSPYANNGVTKLEQHWWGYTVYLSGTTLKTLGGGVALGTLWLPAGFLAKILGTVFGAVAFVPDQGVAFDMTWRQPALVGAGNPGAAAEVATTARLQ